MTSSDSSWSNEYGGDSGGGGGCLNSFFVGRQRKRARLSAPAAATTAVLSSSDAIVNGGGAASGGGGGTYSDLVKEMNKLSVEEREKVYNDVHGVSDIQEETPQFVQRCLDEMDSIIQSTPTKRRRTYNRATFLYPGLIHDRKFKLMFLRADEFDPDKAARRMLKYYDQKRILFGEEKLVKEPITLSDLNNEEEITILKNGFMSEVPVKDSSGRSVLLTNMSQMKFDCWQTDSVVSYVRGFWYIIMNFMDDELNQRKGICIVMNCVTELLKHPNAISFCSELAMKTGYLTSYCLPLRFTSLHFCYDDPRLEFMTNIIRMAVGRGRSLRLRCHLGSQVENQYALMTFGICCDSLLQTGENGTYYHGNEDRVQQRLQIDEENDKTNDEECMKIGLISYPGPNDVLIGRGRPYRDYPCNACWNDIINSNVDRYRKASSRTEKMGVTREVTKLVQDSKIRFLLEKTVDDDGKLWKVLDPSNIREKVSVALQNKAKIITRMETATTTQTQQRRQQQHQQDHQSNNNLMPTTTIAINADPNIATRQQQKPSFLFGDPFSDMSE